MSYKYFKVPKKIPKKICDYHGYGHDHGHGGFGFGGFPGFGKGFPHFYRRNFDKVGDPTDETDKKDADAAEESAPKTVLTEKIEEVQDEKSPQDAE